MVDNQNATVFSEPVFSEPVLSDPGLSEPVTVDAPSPTATHAQALAVLRELVGNPAAGFHEGQYEAIEALVDGGRRALVVQRTGWGKSATSFKARSAGWQSTGVRSATRK